MALVDKSISFNGTCSVEEKNHFVNHSYNLLKFANEARQDGRFNDITIHFEKKLIRANKMVLSCYSEYFNAMFNTELDEKYKDDVEVHGVEPESFEKLVDFMYTGKININTNNVCELLAVCDYLQVLAVKELCIRYLSKMMSPQNCITIQVLADRFTIPQITEQFNKCFVTNYQQVVSSKHFKKLSKDDVIKLLQSTHGKVSSDLLYKAVMNWVKLDLASNENYLSEIIKFVDFYQMSPKMLQNEVSVEPLIRKLGDLSYPLFDAVLQQSKNTEKSLISLSGTNILTKVTKFDLRTKQWSQLPDLPVGQDKAAAVVIDDVLYYLGGDAMRNGRCTTNIVHRLKLKGKILKWEKVAPMNVKRWGFGAAVLNGTIFVFGGADDRLAKVLSGEYYVVSLNKWIKLKPMKIARHGHSIVAHNGHLYSLGGHSGKQITSSVERYDPLLDEWKDVAPMQTRRGWFAAVVLNNAIYAIGGYDGNESLSSVEKYNLNNDTWVYAKDMKIEKNRHSACVAQNKIYVVGGVNSNGKVVKSIEYYDDQTDKWSVVGETEVELYNHSLVAV
uniref:kelch-like protein 12 isoform X1 n=1 Tax=Ciona intestinalis TaxID=7719 RepID=UPI000180CAF5|nr:kelch-like protein 12 isoform X1 [Ciona intestinalis]|eukprot:XP_002125111.1 kelch-like protein 12 isoform X1 [Ciona intestinalis]